MPISFTMRVSLPSDTLIREVDGEAVMLNLSSERYFGLDDVGTRMVAVLRSSGSIQEAYEVLLAEYDADPELLRRDLHGLVEKLAEHGLLEVSCE